MTQFIVDEAGNTTAVVLDVGTYRALVEAASGLHRAGAMHTVDEGHTVVVSLAEARALYQEERPEPLTDEERAVALRVLDRIDELAVEIGEAWQDGMSADEAVEEQRREL
jgi:hypothetical protein